MTLHLIYRFRSKRQKHKVVTCSVCKSIRRFNTKADPFATLSMDEMPHGSKDSVNVFLAPPTLTCNSINEHNPNSGKKGKKRRRWLTISSAILLFTLYLTGGSLSHQQISMSRSINILLGVWMSILWTHIRYQSISILLVVLSPNIYLYCPVDTSIDRSLRTSSDVFCKKGRT